MNKKKLEKMFENLCCSHCKRTFSENSINIIRKEENFYVLNIICENCKTSFGIAFLGLNSISIKESEKYIPSDKDILNIEETSKPISYDDVLDAHHYIKNFDKNWQNYLKENNLT